MMNSISNVIGKNFIRTMLLLFCMISVIAMLGSEEVHAFSNYEKTYAFSFLDNISGTAGQEITDTVYTISFKNGVTLKKAMLQDMDITDWFAGEESILTPGLRVVIAEDALVGATGLKIKFTGIAYGASQDNMAMRVRNTFFDDDETDLYAWANVSFGYTKPNFNIVKSDFTQPSGTGAVGNGIYFKNSDGLTGNSSSGWKLSAKKNVEITSNNELTVYINGYMITSLGKDQDISSWFTGETWGYNSLLGITTTSFLPDGVTAKLKKAVNIGDNSFTIVFKGKPAKGSKDFIAFTIPKGICCHSGNSGSKAYTVDPLRVTNVTGKYAYNIDYDDYSELYSQFIRVTYPNIKIPNGSIITAEDQLIAEYEIVGYTGTGEKLKFKDIKVGDKLPLLTHYEEYQEGGVWKYRPSDCVSTYTGLDAEVCEINNDQTKFKVLLTGRVSAKYLVLLPYSVGIYPFAIEAARSNAGNYVPGFLENEGEFVIVQPEPHLHLSAPVKITSTKPWLLPTVENPEVVITLGDDTLARDFSVGTELGLSGYTHENPQNHANIISAVKSSLFTIKVSREAKKGDKKLYVTVLAKYPYKDYTGFVELAMPAEYLTKASTYGTQEAYYFEVGGIYLDVKEHLDYCATCSEIVLSGSVTRKYVDTFLMDSEGTLTPITILDYAPIGKEKKYFTVTTLKDIHVDKDYAVGDDVTDLVRFQEAQGNHKLLYSDDNPFYNTQVGDSPYFQNPEEHLYKIRAAKAISKDADGESSAHTFELYIDLSELTALSPSTSNFEFRIYNGKYFERVYPETVCKFNIAPEGELPAQDNSNNGNSTLDPASGIIYNNAEDIIIYATDASGKTQKDTYINLTSEKLVTDLSYDCYSLNGGSTWKAVKSAFTDAQFAKLLNKEMTFCIADKFDKKAKKPADGATIYKFGKTNAKPAAPKLKVDYVTYADPTGATAGQWTLTDTASKLLMAEDLSKLEIGIVGSDKKKVDENGYGSFPVGKGIQIKEMNGMKSETTTYYVRVKATDDTPASKAAKVTVKGQQKAPKVKADYKKETLKVKKGMTVYFGETITSDAAELTGEPKNYDDYAGKYVVVTEDMAKNGIDISNYITDSRNTIKIWMPADGKKPATAAQTIVLPKRGTIEATTLTVSNGKLKLDNKYEVYNAETGKWGKLPAVSASGEYKIRLKATAKGGAENDTTFAASSEAKLKITYGVVNAEKNKSGVTAAEIILD